MTSAADKWKVEFHWSAGNFSGSDHAISSPVILVKTSSSHGREWGKEGGGRARHRERDREREREKQRQR